MSGAGRAPKAASHAGAVLENLSPYAVGAHRHAPEIEQLLGFPVCFVPHLLPVRRGLLATCYVRSDEDVRALLEAAYAASPVVRVLPEGVEPEIARVQGTDAAEIGVFADRATGTAIVICALDNLGKGAAGQAVQNANLALGLAETAGLRLRGVLVMSVGSTELTGERKCRLRGSGAGRERHRREGLRRLRRRTPASGTAKPDLAIVRSRCRAVGAAMFTRNRVQAACLRSTASTSRSPSRRRS